MYDPELWPAGTFVRRYFEPRWHRDFPTMGQMEGVTPALISTSKLSCFGLCPIIRMACVLGTVLAFVNAFIEDYGSTCTYVVGDFNADISKDNSLFAKQLLQFCYANNLIIWSKMFLPVKSYTYVSEAWHTVSWLDHCISTTDVHALLVSMKICNELATTNHIPVVMTLNVENIPMSTVDDNRVRAGKLD